MAVSIGSVESTELFVGPDDEPLQVLRVALVGVAHQQVVAVTVTGAARGRLVDRWLGTPLEVPVSTDEAPGSVVAIDITVEAGDGRCQRQSTFTVAEPGWTMYMVSHFHYDPVWWNTQAAYTSEWTSLPAAGSVKADFQHAAFDLVRAHLDLARRDPDYHFVLAEVDYLKPYWDLYPQDRALVRRLLAEGRLELMGGTYNEPNTNLTGAETTIRNAVYGIGFQRDIVGGDPATAWQLDAFGHDPQFPGLMADAGLTSSSWARGPFHQWGPNMTVGAHETPQVDPVGMQFGSEFEWISPSGRGLPTAYMPLHYSAGWKIDSAATLEAAEAAAYAMFRQLAMVATTRNVLLPVGGDYTPPTKWVTAITRDWNARYAWPKFRSALPREFFAAVSQQLAAEGRSLSPQTRDMNPIYTGKDVSYIDTKLAQRLIENLLVDAEKFASLAAAHGIGSYPHAALDKAWRQLAFGAHHDGITGSESDQVYLDLVTGWRDAWELAVDVHGRSTRALAEAADTSGDGRALTVFNASSWDRDDLVTVRVTGPERVVLDAAGRQVPVVVEHAVGDDAALLFRATGVPSLGYQTYRLVAGEGNGWNPADGTTIANEFYRLTVDPERGGAVSSLVDLTGDAAGDVEQITAGQLGNEIVLYDEYPEHPVMHEGPWHLLPTGSCASSASAPARSVLLERSALGERITVTGAVGSLTYTQRLTLWYGERRLDCVTTVDTFHGQDELVRLRWACAVPGALPVSEVADAVVGRGFAHPDVDSAQQPWTLDNPAYGWFGLTSTARVALHDEDGNPVGDRAIGIAEIVVPTAEDTGRLGRDLSVALVRSGVTATCSFAEGFRYGNIAFDSNLPDVRISVGGPAENAFTATVLAAAGSDYSAELQRQLDLNGAAAIWVPAVRPLAESWVPDADLTGPLDLPVLVIAASGDLEDAVALVVEGLRDARIHVHQPAALSGGDLLEDRTVAILNRGLPGFAVDSEGRLHLSLMRSCTGWPSGVWIDPPRRYAPDGSGFQLQHWTHTFDYSLVAGAGDWRDNDLVAVAHDYNHPLVAVVTEAGDGSLPATQSLLRVEPAKQVVLATLKATGHPYAHGRTHTGLPAAALTARLYEATGRDADVSISMSLPLIDSVDGDLLEVVRPGASATAGTVTRRLAACDVSTLLLTAGATAGASAGAALGPVAEPIQPVHSRYWLHNRGPAGIGNQLVSVFAEPTSRGLLRVTVSSELADEAVEARLVVVTPAGWDADPSDRPVSLAPGGWTQLDVALTVPAGATPGPHPILVRLEHAGQTFEDVLLVDGDGQPVSTYAAAGRLETRLPEGPIVVTPGSSSELVATLHSTAGFDLHGEAQVVSPWGTWELISAQSQGFAVPGGGSSQLVVPLVVPVNAPPGEWWLLVKTMYFGQVSYSATVPLHVEAKP
jgi:alpha-mannosidase